MNTFLIVGGLFVLLFVFVLLMEGGIETILDRTFSFFREDMTPDFHVHKWKHGTIKVPVEDRWGRDIPDMTIPHRVCKECGQKQYRTMLPSCNGWDDNTWNNYKGNLKLKS